MTRTGRLRYALQLEREPGIAVLHQLRVWMRCCGPTPDEFTFGRGSRLDEEHLGTGRCRPIDRADRRVLPCCRERKAQ
jgi:hypothetical protein